MAHQLMWHRYFMCKLKRKRPWHEFHYPSLWCRTHLSKSLHPPASTHHAWSLYFHPRNAKCPIHGPGLTSPNERSQKSTCTAKTPQPKQTKGPVLGQKFAFWCTLSDQIAAATGLLQGQAAGRQRLAPGAAMLRQGLSGLLEILSIKTQIRFTGSCCSFSNAELQGSLRTECRCCYRN